MWLRFALGFLWLTSFPLVAQESVQVNDPWIRAMPPGMSMTAGFMNLRNLTAQPLTLVAVESPAFARIEMHRTEIDAQGVARMLAQTSLLIPAQGELSLAPKGNHLMLFDPKQPLQVETPLPLTLVFADGSRVTVQAQVQLGLDSDQMDHSQHH